MMEPTESAPAWAYYELGLQLNAAEEYEQAQAAFEQAASIDPNIPGLRTEIAFMHWRRKNYRTALDIYEAVVRDTPDDVSAWSGLAVTRLKLRQWDQALAAAERAFKLNPTAVVLQHYATILAEFRKFKRARYLLERAVALAPENPKCALCLAHQYLEAGDYERGWKLFEARWRLSKKIANLVVAPSVPNWRGENLATTNLLVWPDPWLGLGDEILMLRFVIALAERATREGGMVMLACHEPNVKLVARSVVEHSDVLFVTTSARGQAWQPQHFIGRKPMQIPEMSLPACVGKITAQLPYLIPDPVKVTTWRERLSTDKNVKVGLAWTGRDDHPRNDLRSVPLNELASALKDIPDVSLYSLQPGHSDPARAAGLIDLTSELKSVDDTGLKSVDDTAALVSNLDLVISIDAMIAHLAGALNVPTWVMVDTNPAWMWGRHEKTTVWYPSATIFRQHRMHQWAEVLEDVRASLAARALTLAPS